MKKTLLIPAMLLLLAGCTAQTPTNTTQDNTNASATTGSQKFSDQPYYSYSYLISGDTLSADAKTALAGFDLNKQVMPDGTTQIMLKAQKAEYHDQQYTLQPGQQLYFLERMLGDDQNNNENNLGDDSAVVVDAQGNVVQPPADWRQ